MPDAVSRGPAGPGDMFCPELRVFMIISVSFASALICAALMGYAIQSGATCTVYAVSELIEKRRASRLIAMLEAGLWVAVVVTLAGAAQLAVDPPRAYAPTLWTIAGGLLLGLGAFVNGACVFGSVARIGSGEIGFIATPLGYFLGVLVFDQMRAAPQVHSAGTGWQLPILLALAIGAYALIRASLVLIWTIRRTRPDHARLLWDPHEATLVIGVTFAIMMLSVGRWTYPELLSDLAHGKDHGTLWRIILFLALLAGARLAGYRQGKTAWITPTRQRIAACLCGGAMMGMGGTLIPGGNDGLVLVGLPFLMPYALLALAVMVGVIALAIVTQTTWMARRAAPQPAAD